MAPSDRDGENGRARGCPTCGRPPRPKDDAAYPFCSRRCKLADLGAWLDERYRIPAPDEVPDTMDQGGGDVP
ncbi:MAG: DNA gyrase inhibitor YacG [Deltaproteobacteria bacterium]|nr:MAG: DNA gyrase inhibitor YacG [Deltaproteobacteria bacterium]